MPSHIKEPRFFRDRLAPLIVGMLLLAMVAAPDWVTGPELNFSLFYLLPVCWLTWRSGRRAGWLGSTIAAGVWLCVDRLTGAMTSDPLIAHWNLLMRLVFFAGAVVLLTAWKNIERRLSAMVVDRTAALRDLAVQLSAAEDAERRRLAYDVHDSLSQGESLIKMNLDSAQLDTAEPTQQREHLTACGLMIESLIKQAKTLMFDLHPAMLDDLGLVSTLEWYADQFGDNTGVEVMVSEHGIRQALSQPTTNYLFRAAKELLNNAVRHGRAKAIIVTLFWDVAAVRLVIDDDGAGFDLEASKLTKSRRGLGLLGIDERVTSMGGTFIVESAAGQGTRIIIDLPLKLVAEEPKNAVASAIG